MGYSYLAYTLVGRCEFRNFGLHSIQRGCCLIHAESTLVSNRIYANGVSTLRYVRRFLLAKDPKHPPRRDLSPTHTPLDPLCRSSDSGCKDIFRCLFLDTIDIEYQADYRGIC